MTRLPGRVGAARAQHSSTRAKFRKHKVIMESVTQQRKKLRSIISFEADAPPGYTFIPAGNPQFTLACKELCREQGLKVFTVTTTPHQNTHGLSQQVHRVGYHFPSTVVAKKCMDLGLYVSGNGNVMPFESFGTKFTRTDGDVEVSQITINTEARDVIRDLFPNIPDDDINQIIKTAFQKGQRKVGTAVELPLARRAQLAVVAHIRHVYTDYDKLLKKTSFQEARRQVEDSTLERLVHWRGDDESGMPELEDVFREVIVISDDEEEEEEEVEHNDIGCNKQIPSGDRDLSVEILSTQVVTDKLDVNANDTGNHSVSAFPVKAKESISNEYHFVAGANTHTFGKQKIDRRGFSRYQAWDRAMNRYREKKQAPDILRFPDGSVFGKIPPATSNKRSSHSIDFPSTPIFVAGPRISSEGTLEKLSKEIDLIDLTGGEDANEFPKRRRLGTRKYSREIHRPSSYADDLPYSYTGKPVSQHAPVVMRSRYLETMREGVSVDRMPIMRNDPVPLVINGSREETSHPLYHSIASSSATSVMPTIQLESPEIYNGIGSSGMGRPRMNPAPLYRDHSFKVDGYETDSPRLTMLREDRPASSHHVRGSGSDDAVWRNKANSYMSQRRLLETRDSSWLASAPKPSFHLRRVQRSERVTHSPAFTQEDIMDPSPTFNVDGRAENALQQYGIQNRRVSSQPPLSDTQRKRDTLPASAMRRYEVQLERSLNSRRYEPAPHQER
ncbi:hypothetical protein UA08_04356 [Talaromyces atroroseus]|uniref:DUF2293 domain-containing protein n=1 Tax=Talaromyces atroroseus TaxID=1441469 RepID=A0A1Q5Q945_TALAT|nr:hypothetical protein UA08_04356 [Talaromyces atroroseus]OKL60592.1 hypothetical protein UA08_04356 [Talaromyces atroroseus]